jgi:outer membrane protein assembly factor BamB
MSRPVSLLGWSGGVALVVGLITFGTTPFSTPTASTSPPLSVTQTWVQDLNDAPCGVAEASPVEVTLDPSGPSVEVGDRSGHLYAFHLSDGSAPAAWSDAPPSADVGSGEGCGIAGNDGSTTTPALGANGISVPGNPPIDSTASVMTGSTGSTLYFGAGNAAEPIEGGYYAYGANGQLVWNQLVTNPPTDTQPDVGVQASPSIGSSSGVPFVSAGSLGQESYTLRAANGAPLNGWPYFSADSVFSTGAVGDLYGTGQDEIVVGGASTAGFAYGSHYANGGHLRILNQHGGLICAADSNEEVDSSPAVGPILPGGAFGIATGTGSYYAGSDEDTVKVFDTQCHQVWSDTLDGATGGSPALADVLGNGQLAVVEGTNQDNHSGSVWALNASTGTVIWKTQALGAVIGSVTTADLSGDGSQDVVVATTGGLEILDGKTGAVLVHVDDGSDNGGAAAGKEYGFQNSPLITNDGDGEIGITVAGYFALAGSPDDDVQGVVQHFTVNGSNGALADAAGGWPQFHHDPQLTGFAGTTANHLTGCQIPPAATNGYLTVAADGGVFAFGGQQYCGSTGNLRLNGRVVGMAMSPDHGGYWLVGADGGIFSYGVPFYGSAADLHLNQPIVGMAATPDGGGYWLVGADGGVFTYGDARYYGSGASVPNAHVVAIASSPDGGGYWEVTASGVVWAFGDAGFYGDARHVHLAAPIVSITPDPVTGGYWLVGADGGVFSFNAPFFGAIGPLPLHGSVVGMAATDDGQGYWIVAADGGVFSYGDAPFSGSEGGTRLNDPMVGIVGF